MTTPSTPRKAGPLLGTGAQTSWPFTFKVFAASDIAVTIANNLGVETALVLNADYSVTLNSNQDTSPGGTVTYPISGGALPTGSKLTIFGNLPYDQPLDLPSGGNFSPLALENQLDRLTMQIQQLRELAGRSLQLPVTSAPTNVQLPQPVASNIIGWNENADNLENYPLSELATSLAFATYRYDTFTGNGSTTQFTLSADPVTLGNLDVAVGGVTQTPGADYLLVAGVIEFTSAPPIGVTILARFGEGIASGPSMDSYDVRFRQAGTGSVDRTAEAKLRETVSVKDFGAVGDGVADDTAAIQAAFSYAGGKNIDIILPGKHIVTSTCTAPSNARIIGGEILVRLTGVNYDLSAAISIEQVENLTIDGVKFSGLSATPGQIYCNAIFIDYSWPGNTPSKNIKITNCTFDRLTGFGITAHPIGGAGWTISDNTFILEGGAGTVRNSGGSSTQGISAAVDLVFNTGNTYVDGLIFSNNNIIIDTTTQKYQGVAFKVQGAENSTVNGNIATIVGSNGIQDNSSGFCELHLKSSNVYGNWFADPLDKNIPGFLVAGCQNTTFSNNVVNGASIQIRNYSRSSPSVSSANLTLDGFTGQPTDPSNAIATYGVVLLFRQGFTSTGITVSDFAGTIGNFHNAASSIQIRNSYIKSMMFPNSTLLARTTFNNCTFNAVSTSQSYTVSSTGTLFLQNCDIYGSTVYGNPAATSGNYTVDAQNTSLVNNKYINPIGGAPTGAITQTVNNGTRVIEGCDTNIIEDINNFIGYNSKQNAVFTTGAYQRRTIDTAAPTGSKWVRGDFVWNSQPSAAGYAGWSCVTSGYAVKGAWTTGVAYIIGDWVSNAGNIYRATTAGTSGATAPTHTSGTASDGAVTWLFVATSAVAAFKASGAIAA
jgi:hypothetical protein